MAMREATERVIGLFGGITGLARALGHRHPTTVQGWRDRGRVPSEQIPEVIDAGRKAGVSLTHEDFFIVPAAENKTAKKGRAA
jgi:hypothetical protein